MTQPMKTLVGGFAFLECPRWHDGKLWMVDMHRDLVVVVSEDGSTEEITVPGRPGGMGWFQDGSLAVAATQNRKIMRYHDGELSTYCDMSDIGDSEHEINDLVMDANDRCYVGEFGVDVHAWMAENVPKVEEHGIAILAEAPLDEADVFLVENGQATVAASGLRFPNGAAISVDQTRYVVAETFGLRLSEYKLIDGVLSDRRIIDLGFGPDGISRMDEQGGIWLSDPMGSKVHRVDATGAITDTVECDLPAYACEIGGSDGHTLFVCLASSADPNLTVNTRDARIDTVQIGIPAAH
ncbi:sugar lactone lactonase YvrE [Antricoccus suffuscus]|uniref:Sugar lactone lactonase YvrE n=1 Tax=Antricoccus suffuscus TaxID=1629062 RepID=A0A2T0ZEK4_9ACTN|nr:SMP-30/gluconolactonase/LRE family protein [Antricoccus suffuscus]PRZ34775.1 sugar lactone lactonase YvrE [Antricoccus suffuscus]